MQKNLWLILTVVLLAVIGCKPAHKEAVKNPAEAAAAARAKTHEELVTWNKETTVNEYEDHASHNPSWDSEAKRALGLYAELRSGPEDMGKVEQDLRRALQGLTQVHCDDPLINYLALRSEVTAGVRSNKEAAADFRQAADRLVASQYSPIRKFYGVFRAAQSSIYINKNKVTPPEFYPYRQQMLSYLEQVVRDRSVPDEEIYQILHNVIEARFWAGDGLGKLDTLVNNTLFTARPVTALSYLIRGEHETEYGWLMRGNGYAYKVTDEGWKGFSLHLGRAAEAVQKSWDMDQTDARIPTMMLAVVQGNGDNRAIMEKWFKRAMDLNPYNYNACSAKLEYLQPKWYGSPEAMLSFGRECVQSSTWKGTVPLILVDAHYKLSTYLEKSQRSEYWKDPAVWPDVKAAYEKFFELNPEAYGYRHNYAYYAWACQQWDDLRKQLPLMVSTNYAFFGGEEKFQQIVKDAQEHQMTSPSK